MNQRNGNTNDLWKATTSTSPTLSLSLVHVSVSDAQDRQIYLRAPTLNQIGNEGVEVLMVVEKLSFVSMPLAAWVPSYVGGALAPPMKPRVCVDNLYITANTTIFYEAIDILGGPCLPRGRFRDRTKSSGLKDTGAPR